MKIFFSFLVLLIATKPIYSQTLAIQTASAVVNLIQPLSISAISGAIDFGEIIVSSSLSTVSISPNVGKVFQVLGHPNRNITVTFNTVTLTNNFWVSQYGGQLGSLVFTPSVQHTGASSSYSPPVTSVTSGSSHQLVNSGGYGILYIWVGGSISILANQPHGDYTGIFTINVSY